MKKMWTKEELIEIVKSQLGALSPSDITPSDTQGLILLTKLDEEDNPYTAWGEIVEAFAGDANAGDVLTAKSDGSLEWKAPESGGDKVYRHFIRIDSLAESGQATLSIKISIHNTKATAYTNLSDLIDSLASGEQFEFFGSDASAIASTGDAINLSKWGFRTGNSTLKLECLKIKFNSGAFDGTEKITYEYTKSATTSYFFDDCASVDSL